MLSCQALCRGYFEVAQIANYVKDGLLADVFAQPGHNVTVNNITLGVNPQSDDSGPYLRTANATDRITGKPLPHYTDLYYFGNFLPVASSVCPLLLTAMQLFCNQAFAKMSVSVCLSVCLPICLSLGLGKC